MNSFDSAVLELASEDFTGLWEFVWAEQSKNPHGDSSELLENLRESVKGLVANGRLQLYRGTRFAGEEKLVDTGDAIELIDEGSSWKPPKTSLEHLRVLTANT